VTLLDAAAGYVGLYNNGADPDRRSATLSLTTHFLYKGDGGELRATGTLQRAGRSVYFSRAEVWNTNHEMIATAVGVYKYATLNASSNDTLT
jgi:acyl-coenzyme A thioesterase PaaI-like protein